MNTKFDVGQRVTYPVVQTLEGKITGIAVSKAGVTRYAIGARLYEESDLTVAEKPTEDKPTSRFKIGDKVKIINPCNGCTGAEGLIGTVTSSHAPSGLFDTDSGINVATEHGIWRVNEDGCEPYAEQDNPTESDPVKLYCVKSFMSILSAGKIYEPDKSGYITYDDGRKSNHPVSDWKFDFVITGNLVPLVRRPAKVGEWIYPLEDCPFGRYKKGELLKCTIDDKNVTDVWRRKAVEYNNSRCVIKHDEYLVLGGYAGEPA